MDRKNSKRRLRTGLLFALWVLALLVLIIIFLAKKDDFIANWNFAKDRITGTTTELAKNDKQKPKENSSLQIEVIPPPGSEEANKTNGQDTQNSSEETTQTDNTQQPQSTEQKSSEEKPGIEQTEKIDVKLCFVQVNEDGKVTRHFVTRQVAKDASPLTNAIRALLVPPADDDNYISLIPEGTRLLGANVRNGIASLNFSEEFEFNPAGAEGYRAQFMQIVYTATEFATVEQVQFLVENQHKEYIGSGEDISTYIGTPFSRRNFN